MRFHPLYSENEKPNIFDGTFEDLKGGEYLGTSARPEIFRHHPGAVIVATYINGVDSYDGNDYYYDPEFRIPGSHYRCSNGYHLWVACNPL